MAFIQHAAMAMHQATQKRGMLLNFDKGKTEVLWHILQAKDPHQSSFKSPSKAVSCAGKAMTVTFV